MATGFNTLLRDSQGTKVQPVSVENFDLQGYAEYEAELLEKNKKFVEDKSGILVYRRVRADGVFYDKCRDYKESLALQLGALQTSMQYRADIANFLEPWYGIGYIAACFGAEYVWKAEQAPSVEPLFSTAAQILEADFKPIEQTPMGKYILEMITYFVEQTKGKIPISFCDIQAPLNMLSYLMPITDLFMEIYDDPDTVKAAANRVAELLVDFLKKQEEIIGDALVKPGHGFASSRVFKGAGMSDDNSIMIQAEDYQDLFQKADEKIGAAFGGTVYHSCGNWENKIDMVKQIKHMTSVDGAFSIETDPSPNDPFVFGEAFDGTGIVVNARAVGDAKTSFEAFRQIWRPQQKLIAVTYCEDPGEQEKLYRMLHELEEE
ncbi:MAG: uroporphyrinogen decarboxylase family protein [Lachnospiraceae bacterium]|nr:uroporphyrinogen decarboxylase family protein [Lachnospiraceae bacterium]